MKKILMTLAAVAVATTMNAQVWFGGQIGFTQDHVSNSKVSTNDLFVKPEIGYNLDDKFAVAVALGYQYQGTTGVAHTNTWSIQPYLRYTFVKAGNFAAFIDGGLTYSTAHEKGLKKNTNSLGVFVKPGIAYNVSEKVTLVAHLGNLDGGAYFKHSWNGEFAGDTKYPAQASSHSNHWGLQLLNGISFGAYYNL